MAQHYNPRIVTDGLVMCLDPSQNKSYPTDLPVKDGLIMWMDAADDTTFSYSSGTTVSQWRDKSGFNYHMTPLAGSPTRNAFLNSRKVLAFTTAQDIQNLSIDLRTSPYTVFIISRYTSPSAGTGRILTSNGGYNNWLLGHWASETNKYYANGWVYSTYVALDTNWKMYLGDWGGPSNDLANFYGAGTAIATNSADASAGPWTLGINANSGERSNCEAAEIIVFNKVLSTIERRLVHTYLGQKWGISNTDRSIVDMSGGGYAGLLGNGTVANMPLYNYYNKGTLKFDGTDDYIINTVPSIASSSTIGLWIKCASYDNKIPISIAGTIYGSGPNIFFYNSTINWNIGDGGANPFTNSSYPDSNWHYIVITNQAGTNAKLYIDGVLIGTAAYRNTVSTNSNNFWIGRFSGDNNYTINANIAATQLYNRVLSASEVLQNYEAQKSKFTNAIVEQGLVLNLDAGNPYSYAGSGSAWYDASGTGNNGTLTNGPTYNSTNGGVVVLDGVDDYVTCANSTSLQITSALTLEIWFYNTAFVDGLGMIVKGPLSSDYDYMLYLSGNSSTVYFYKKDSLGSPHYGGVALSLLNRWLHIVVTHTSGGLYTMYVNGLAVDSATFTNSSIRSSSNPLYIGAGWNPDYFYGNIGETRIYNVALSATQVLQNYNATKGRYGL